MDSNILATASFEEILDDLSSRFIINVPENEQQSPERICFQVEQAHWFYEDFVRLLQPNLPSFQLKTFSERIFKHCPLLKQWAHQHEKAYADFMQYRFRIPVCGAIILNENLDKCVLVKGWSSKSGWSFPRGKINQDESYDHCAIREVYEETGFDIGPLLTNDFLEVTIREQSIRLYVVCGVPEDTVFRPQTRKEISQVEWFKVDDLPGIKGAPGNRPASRFYMVVPFVCKLKIVISNMRKTYSREKGGNKKNPRQKQKKKASPTSTVQPSLTETTTTPEPSSVALKSLLGVAPTEEEKVPEPSVALKSLLGVQNPRHQTPDASRSASSTSTPEQSSSTETTLLQLLQRSTPPPPPSPPSQEPSQSLIALLNESKPKPIVEEKPPEHPLIALLRKGGLQPQKMDELASGQP